MNFLVKLLQIQPIVQLKYEGTLLGQEVSGKIVVCVHQEKVRSRSITPLQTGIDIEVINLAVVLYKSSPE